MERKWIIIIAIIGILLGITGGILISNRGKTSRMNVISEEELAQSQIEAGMQEGNNQVMETASMNNNISPNGVLVQKSYYQDCDHLIRKVYDIPEDLINQNEEAVKEKYPGWKIEKYTPTEITLYQEFNGFCDEHYVAREHNGYIGIYTVNKQGVETLKEDTEITTLYLPEEDLERLKIGISIVGERNLYNFLEDYE